MSYLQHIVIDGLDYQIALPHQDTDYIQGKIAKESAPYELPMLSAMVERVSPGDLVLDVGANIGNHSLYLAAAGCKVHAFEPNASLCEALQQSIKANGFESNIEVYNLGLGAQTGKAHFNHLDSNNLGAQSLSLDDGESGEIRIIRLDDIKFYQKVKAIKIDVEGMELPVLQGAARLIERDRPALYIECQTAEDFITIKGWVSEIGYYYWDTFNATPTHLFLHETVIDTRELIDRLTSRLVLESYEQTKKHEQLSIALNEARIKYRGASEQIDKMRGELQSNKSRSMQSEAQLAELKAELGERQQRTIVLLQRAERLNNELADVKRGRAEALRTVKALQSSATFKAGEYLRSAAKSPIDTLKLPLRLWRLTKKAGLKKSTIEQKRLPPTPLSPIPSSSLAVDYAQPNKGPVGPFLEKFSSSGIRLLRVACIMDDFTYGSYQPECELQQLTPDNWQGELEAFQPELLFIESAWRGKDELWGSKVGHTSKELQGIVSWCRTRGIPTVFWNKEDPVHFETFLNTARLFDFVFTTDIDCIHRYKAALKHDRIFFLPFACQPTVHNPIEKYERNDAFCFAGAYYVRYPDRTRDLEDFVSELPSFRPFAIYDRNYGKNNPEYQFPETYRPYIVGTLPYDQIDKAYKGYRYAINLNSIKQSQTMFARRIYELLGSNTLVVSNYSRGVRLMFGDIVVTSDSGAEIKRRLEALLKGGHTDRLRLAGLRKVMLEHTYGERFAYMLSKVTGREVTQPLPSFKVLAAADTLEAAQRIVAQVQAQTGIDASLTILLASGLNVAEVRAALPTSTFAFQLLHAKDEQGKQLSELADDADWVAGMVADDYYGPHYLLDIALATRYSDAHAIGKGAWYTWEKGQCEVNDPDAAYRPASRLSARRSAIEGKLAENIDAAQWLALLGEWTYEYAQQLAIDPYNYCADALHGDLAAIRNTVDDLPANNGASLKELINIAEAVPPMQHQEIDTPYLNGRELAHLLSGKPSQLHTSHEALSTEEQRDEAVNLSRNKAIDAVLSGSTLQIRSTLPDGTHEYLYAATNIDCNELLSKLPESTGRKIPIHLETEPGLNLSLVALYLDADKNRIGHIIEQPNRNHYIDLPYDATYLGFGLRVHAGGSTRIKRLLLGHLDLEPQEILGQSDVLLLTNHYPSYDDLYRNGFVHSRVRAYRERGVNVDVFRLRENQPIAWHEFQDIDVITGSQEALRRLLASGRHRHLLVHFLDPVMWAVLKDFIDTIPVTVWVHGAEIHPWYRRRFNIQTHEQEQNAKAKSEQRMAFWRSLLQPMPSNLKLVFVSKTFSEEVMEDLGFRLPENHYTIIHNPVDTELFAYEHKPASQRAKILSIRPFASRQYANDLSVEAIKLLSKRPFFNELEFRLIGDGALFDTTVAPLRDFTNVTVERRFLTQKDIAALHKEYGIFLCPSRWDSQGVSRDEAMASGLVPVTNAVAAIPEFVDEQCGILAPEEDATAMAEGIANLYKNAEEFDRFSRNAVKTVRALSAKRHIIGQELKLFTDSRRDPANIISERGFGLITHAQLVKKYVLAKGYYGMGGNIAVVLCALRLARASGRHLLVDWIDGVYRIEGEDIFKLLFDAPSGDLSRDELASLRVWPAFWQAYVTRTMPYVTNLPLDRVRSSQAVDEGLEQLAHYDVWMVTRDDRYWHEGKYRDEMCHLAQELVPAARLRERIDSFRASKLGEGAIAVHFRHGNGEPTVVPPDIEWFFCAVDEFLKRSPGSRVFVCTDCQAVLNRFVERYDGQVVSTEKSYPPLGGGAMHAKQLEQDGLVRAEEAIIDMWLISKCDYIVGSKSFFTGVAMKLNPALRGPNVKVWQPKHRSHRPEPDHVQVAKVPAIANHLMAMGLMMDGLFVGPGEGGRQRIYYLHDLLCEFERPADIDVAAISEKLHATRLY